MPTLLGLNAGTSADGIDAVVARFDGPRPALPIEILACVHHAYDDPIRVALGEAFHEFRVPLETLCHLDAAVGEAFAEAGAAALEAANLDGSDIDMCGSHGQTIYHLPPDVAQAKGLTAATWQVGDPSRIAARLGCQVVSSFRQADMAAGGQGAPLTAILDHMLFTDPEKTRVRLNLGGIANLTHLPPGAQSEDVIAFDTGPGNLLIDQAVEMLTEGKERFDRDGGRAARGRADDALLRRMMSHPYFAQAPPKTTGRELFRRSWVERARKTSVGLSDDDLVATMTAFTPATIAHAIAIHLPHEAPLDEVIVHGGGARNPVLMEGLRQRLPHDTILTTVEDFGIPLQALEPLLFAILGWLRVQGEPVWYPRATGAEAPTVLGALTATATPKPVPAQPRKPFLILRSRSLVKGVRLDINPPEVPLT